MVSKLNFDVAIFTQIGASSCGAVVRNEMGLVMATLSTKGSPVMDSEEAKALACQKAMGFVVDAGFSEIILEGDDVNIMKVILSPPVNLSRLGLICEDIRCLAVAYKATSLRSFSVSCVCRSADLYPILWLTMLAK